MKSVAAEFRRASIERRCNRADGNADRYGRQCRYCRDNTGVTSGCTGQTPQLLRHEFEVVSIRFARQALETKVSKMFLIEVAIEAGTKVKWREMSE